MKIEGANFFNYDAQHLQIVRRETAESIKPNLFRDVDDNVAQALLFTDVVSLSPEAKELLKKLRKQMAGGAGAAGARGEPSIEELIYNLRQLRDLVYGEQKEAVEGEEPPLPKRESAQPPMLQIGGPARRRDASRRAGPPGGPARDLVDRMIKYPRADTGRDAADAREAMQDELAVLGEKMVDTVARFGVVIYLLEPNRPLTAIRINSMSIVAPGERTFDGRPWDGVRGLYDQSRRFLVVGREMLGLPDRSAARHEFAHAFDHTFSVNHKRRQALSVQLWNLFAEQRRGLVTPYAGTNPAEYFAETVEAFFKPRGRELVQEKDPQMYQYLEALFAS